MSFTLETIFQVYAGPKFRGPPPADLGVVTSFIENQYFHALEYLKALRQTKTEAREVWMVPYHMGGMRIVVTKRSLKEKKETAIER